MAKSNKSGRPGGTKQAAPSTLVDRAKARSDAKGKAQPGRPLKGAAAKREAQRRTQRRTTVYALIALAVIGGLVAYVLLGGREDEPETGIADQATFDARQASIAANRTAAGCTEVQQIPIAGRNHIDPGQQPSNWNSNPPSSGDHIDEWLRPGHYPEQGDERSVVHSLEHGYVAIQYKNLAPDQVQALQQIQRREAGEKLVLMPYDGLEADGVALSAWGRIQTCERVDTAVIDAFLDGFMLPRGRLSSAPEPLAS